jgi:hypothetical protein
MVRKEVPLRVATLNTCGYVELIESPDYPSVETSVTITLSPVTKQVKEE